MHSFTHELRSNLLSGVRQQSTASGSQNEFVKHWLSDSGTYPVIAIVGFACGFCTYKMVKTMFFCPDVRYLPSDRQAIIRKF